MFIINNNSEHCTVSLQKPATSLMDTVMFYKVYNTYYNNEKKKNVLIW